MAPNGVFLVPVPGQKDPRGVRLKFLDFEEELNTRHLGHQVVGG